MSISGIQAISIYDDSDPSPANWVVVQKNRIAPGAEFIHQDLTDGDTSQGLEVYAGDETMLEFECFDDQGNDQLRAWAIANKEVKFVVAGLQQNVLCYEPVSIQISEPTGFEPGKRTRTKIKLYKKGGKHSVWSGVNLLDGAVKTQGFATGWQDLDANGMADGFSFNGPGPTTYVNDVQSVETTDDTDWFSMDFVFPVEGIMLTLAATFSSLHAQGTIISLSYRNASNGQVSSMTSAVAATGTPESTAAKTPTGIYYISARIARQAIGTAGASTHEFTNPSLRADNSEEYLNY